MKTVFEEYSEIIPDFPLFQERLKNPLPTHLRINSLLVEPADLVGTLRQRGVHLARSSPEHDTLYEAPGLSSPGNLIEYFLGHIHPQALTSAMAAIVLGPRQDMALLDMCAAPGGKSAHCAQIMGNTGLIVSNDLFAGRHVSLGHTLSRLGVLNTVVTGYQAQEFPMKQRFDYVLADVPCSCEGKFRNRGAGDCYRDNRGRERLPELQKRIILRGFDLLREDGQMLYSTCTYNPDENEAVVNTLLQERDAELLPISVSLDVEPGITQWKSKSYDKRLGNAVRFYPHRVDSVGFFMARIGRRR
ncbi:MAG: RsmB/NOP family class I SAM-dependent RNA methyltransferase [Deltaproteobacteria bacterium]|nr:RsmB/NOP family class I SAM-dependent RNA methyltransferase [Deltaproteobacteria bacterium]MBW2113078.1 RsmB/NOP family class I SAM-dependent RNA methyltransferase [Deltaproteobacteria bacterium]MBW2354419.1 RsmB/NOP family class I SAM-dependent RNA methyltransferase [Deltaproteobacteria bacterium]HDZ91162.1 RsmB/NOP family class I SAM-dependent RNA methyltransferase [Deltaproteobacteria bacterium]